MPYALDVVFSTKAEDAIRRIWTAFGDAGIPSAMQSAGGHPHLSLGVATAAEAEPLRKALSAGTRARPPRSLVLGSVGSFPGPGGIVFLGGVPTSELLAWHEEVHGILKGCCRDVRPYYAPKAWIPHVTLTYQLDGEQIGRALDVARSAGLPIVAEFAGFALMETSPTSVKELWRLPLSA